MTRNLVNRITAINGHEGNEGDHQNENEDQTPNGLDKSGSTDQNYQFYKEYCRLYYANIILTNRL